MRTLRSLHLVAINCYNIKTIVSLSLKMIPNSSINNNVVATNDVLKTYVSKLIKPTDDGLFTASELIKTGKLVAFPTETVYGLGANAFNPDAVASIFTAKGRPLTDPLIVHIPNNSEGYKLLDIDENESLVFDALTTKFWPGPLTIIAKSAPCIPLLVTAHTGFVGVRCPSHPLALALLNRCKLPIAAPSANRFAHVSPTRAHHVLSDLGEKDIHVLDGDSDSKFSQFTCQFGIESTVLKIDKSTQTVQIFRHGAITKRNIESALHSAGLTRWGVTIVNRTVPQKHSDKTSSVTRPGTASPELVFTPQVGDVAPGQALTHYSPDVPCTIVSSVNIFAQPTSLSIPTSSLKNTVLLDFNGQLLPLYPYVLDCRELSSTGDAAEAARSLFDSLRWAEGVSGATQIYVASIPTHSSESTELIDSIKSSVNHLAAKYSQGHELREAPGKVEIDELLYGVADRLHRAASGRLVDLHIHIIPISL